MKWWMLLAAKVVVLLFVAVGATLGTQHFFFPAAVLAKDLAYTFSMLGVSTLVSVLGFAFWMDQKYRCRKCACRLRMPVAKGNFSRNLFEAPPELDWICPFGHGTMHLNHAQLISAEPDRWVANDGDFWRAFERAWRDH